ncbi:Transcriptional regulator, LysR family [Hyella patelloides LEGE 07179]|uniref:Transcriptional regulator, LysR family n=1 Tax=Hyella patelloides LEGE 07179 TaxID=945734 RepID=A0A563W1L9_9CYAN|nr:LysR family transcriptional regulator [Hyella patelloides]VEP17588.1 Transcriptional regulator, LysR family [Hyella patelloides LEGE 07179]
MNIDYTNLRQLDLNLLVALDVLIAEANVTKAAVRLNISQSAMSYSLKRLRTILKDDILIRTSREMEVTPYARQISDRIRQILTEIQLTLLEKEDFNPATANETFRIAASDYVETTIGINLIQQITTQAPGIRIRINNLDKETVMDALDKDRIDLVINAKLPLKSWHVEENLYREEFVCVIRGDNSLTELSIADYIKRSHILVSLRDDFQGTSDEILKRQQQFRQVIWSTPHFMAVPFLLANSDCVALLPSRMAQQCAKTMNLKLLPPPIPIEGFTVSMVWHQRNTNNPGYQWLREQIVNAALAVNQINYDR